MLGAMRRNAKSWIIKFLFGIIVIVFVFFYGFSDVRNRKEVIVASVGDSKISVADYREMYRNLMQFYSNIYQGRLSEDLIQQMDLKQQALESLIDREVLLQEAERRNLQVSTDEIQQAIMENPLFQDSGIFRQEIYEKALQYNQMPIADFEENQAKQLLISKIEDTIKSAIKVSEKELWDQFILENTKVKIEYVTFKPENVEETIEIPTKEIETYYEQHPEEFRVPEKAQAKYITFKPEDFEPKVEISTSEVEEYYQMDLERFEEPMKVKARHILFKVEEGVSPEEEQQTKMQAETILERIEKAEDFAEIAKQYSQDPVSAKQGGDLGYFKKGDMVKSFEEVAFSLQIDEVSSLVKTQYGYHIIKVEDIQEAHVKPFEAVKEVLRKELQQENAKELVRKEAQRSFNRLFKSRDIETYAKEKDLPLSETDYFAYGEGLEDKVNDKSFSESAFSLSVGNLAPVFAIDQRYILLKLVDKKETHIAPFEQAEASIRSTLDNQKKLDLSKQQAEEMLSQLQRGESKWEALAKQHNLEIKTSTSFTRRGDTIPGIGSSATMKEEAFVLTEENPYPNTVFQTERGVFVIKFKELETPSREDFAKRKKQISQMLIQRKEEEIFSQFVEYLKAKTDIKVDTSLLAS
jgi:peptidyl-prolyl cis-trans isomerase D